MLSVCLTLLGKLQPWTDYKRKIILNQNLQFYILPHDIRPGHVREITLPDNIQNDHKISIKRNNSRPTIIRNRFLVVDHTVLIEWEYNELFMKVTPRDILLNKLIFR